MTNVETVPSSLNEIRDNLETVHDAARCLELAAAADVAGDTQLNRAYLERAIGLDRHCQAALLNLAALSLDDEDSISTFGLLEEAARLSPLQAGIEPLREQLFTAVREVPQLDEYLRIVGRTPMPATSTPLSVVVVTSVFSSNDSTASSRALDEVVGGLIARCHRVRVLTSDAQPDGNPVATSAAAVAPLVSRTLRLSGTWIAGRPTPIEDVDELGRRARDNATRLRTAIAKSQATLVLVANVELLDMAILRPALDAGIPVVHWVSSVRLPFAVDDQPCETNYAIAPVSDWMGTALRNAGYETARMDTLHPGVDVDRCFRLFLPDTSRLRICFVSAIRPSSGAEIFVRALAELAGQGVDFTAELAGEVADREFFEGLHGTLREHRLEPRVRFTAPGAIDAVFARNNVYVAAHKLPEPFAVAQVEAMSSGVVVVSNGTGGSKEILRPEIDGLLFRGGDAGDLANKLLSLARDPEKWQRLQRAGQLRARTFSVENAVLNIERLAAEMKASAAL